MNLLREIHYNKTWWDTHIQTETKKRIVTDSDTDSNTDVNKNGLLTLLVVSKTNIHELFKSFKRFIREKYKIDTSYFHCSDPYCFTIWCIIIRSSFISWGSAISYPAIAPMIIWTICIF